MHFKKLLLLLVFVSLTIPSFAQTKHALIVAIGNYPENSNWDVINSINDTALIKNALITGQLFSEQNIQVLADSKATRKGIIDALDKLIADVKENDVVVIHFSSHGEQIEDDGDDEIDGLDEVIVPYDAVYSDDKAVFEKLTPGYLRDDLFGEKVIQLRNKLGKDGDLLVIIDACHSGTGTRGVETAKIRGGKPAMTSGKKKLPTSEEVGVFKESSVAKLSANASRYVLISGAQAKESNYECKDDNNNAVGSLSYSFSKAISSLKGELTYRGLFAMIENIMREKAPKQKPVLEGDGIDYTLFGGHYEKQQLYFTINQKQSNNNQVVLKAGYISGITVGSTINFYETGTTSTAGKKPINTGKVISSNSFTSTVKLDSADDKLVNLNPYAFINELAYGTEKLKLFVRGIRSVDKMLQDSLKDFQLVEFNPACDLYLDTAGSVNNWALKYPNSNDIFEGGFHFLAKDNMAVLKAALKRYNRYRYLKGLTLSETDLSATVQLVFLDANKNIDSVKLNSRNRSGRLELREGDEVYIRVINTGDREFYINIVDMQPNGEINPVMPNKNLKNKEGNPDPLTAENCLVKKNETLLLKRYSIEVSEPFGEETFKVFLSSSILDLEDILTSKDEGEAIGKRGVLNGLEKIFVNSNNNNVGKRGMPVKVNSDQNGTVFSFNFQILPK